MSYKYRPRSAFSLVEMMVVFVLIGLLAGLVTVNVRASMLRGRQNAARAEIKEIANGLEQFQLDEHRYPTNGEGLAILTQTTTKRPEPFLARIPLDPWGRNYQYNNPGRNNQPFEILCLGADGKEGGEGADADITSLDLSSTTPQKE